MSFTLSTGNVVVANASAAVVSQTDTTATIRVTTSAYITDGWVYSTGVVANITINGGSVNRVIFGNGAGYYYASDGTQTKTYEVTVNKTTATQSFPWTVQFWQYTDGTKQTLKQTNTGTVSVKAKTSYSVTYNANGGTGAPAAQTKYYGTALTLSSTKPTRTGYTFSKWNTNSSGTGTSYNAGASYTANAAVTLYAVWTANTYTISYNANGGTGAPSSQTKTYGVDLTLSSTKPTRTNYTFKGWATSATASTNEYSAGGTFKANAATTLYAVWELAYTVPIITGYSASRCTSNGTLDDFGTYVKVIFDWECCQITGANNVSAISIGYRIYGSGASYTATSVSASGTSGSVSQVIGGGNISTESVYEIQISVTDTLKSSNSGKATRVIQVPMAAFIMDFKAGGTGIAIGKPAKLDNTFEVAKKTIFTGGDDAATATSSSGMVLVGDPGGAHLAIDNNEIIAKADATTAGQLNIQPEGGETVFGSTNTFNGTSYFNGNTALRGTNYVGGELVLNNGKNLSGANASGTNRSMVQYTSDNYSMFGYGGYANNEGRAYYDGNVVYIRSKGYIYLTSPTTGQDYRPYGLNKVLWSGEMYMNQNQTASLTDAISAQPHGIVLVWSKYDANGASNTGFAYHFIPKYHASTHNGSSVFLTMGALGASVIGSKCLYIHDTSLTGHSINAATGTDCNVKYTNTYWVLRYVIGV